jgi:hypothetical protein
MGVAETLALVLQVLWIVVSIPLFIVLAVYGSRAADFAFPVMATAAPAAYMFVILGLLALVILFSLLLRFDCICCPTRGIGLTVVLASLVIENLAIAFYGAYGSEMAEAHVRKAIGDYCAANPSDQYTIWWGEYILKNGGQSAIQPYVDDRTITPAKLVFGFALTWFILHTVVFYLIILPRDGLPKTPLAPAGYNI